jgi:hypothetical protein
MPDLISLLRYFWKRLRPIFFKYLNRFFPFHLIKRQPAYALAAQNPHEMKFYEVRRRRSLRLHFAPRIVPSMSKRQFAS